MARSLRTESRPIRPFANLTEIDEMFKSVRLLVDDKEFSPGSVVIPSLDYPEANFRISLGFELGKLKKAIEAAGIPFVDTALVCIGKSKMLKTMHIQTLEPLRKASSDNLIEIDISSAPLVYRDSTGFKLHVAVVLVRNLPKKPLRPSVTGTWLGTAKFSIAPESREVSFSPTKLTNSIRATENLPTQTLSFVKIKNEDFEVLDEEDFEKITTAYLDEEVLSQVQLDEKDPLSEQLITELAHKTIFHLLLAIASSLSEKHKRVDFQDLQEGSASFNLISKVSSQLSLNPTKLLEELNENPSHISASLQSVFAMRKKALSGLRRGESI